MRRPPARSLLWRSLRAYQVYGANTEVGKTVFTTTLCKAARRLWQTENTTFLKPVSTGAAEEADDRCKVPFSFFPYIPVGPVPLTPMNLQMIDAICPV